MKSMMETMRRYRFPTFLLAGLCLLFVAPVVAQEPEKSEPEAKKEESDTARLHVKVTGGENKKPVEGASVYVRFFEERKLARDKRREMNLKTAPDGEVRIPPVPKGKVMIQIVAPGWRTFGKWYDIEKNEETIEIHLERPRRWY
ncbi:MAG TPA: carboxypeptidase-like regulatory domain-containing protein [Sphingomonadales bacterium]|nr:carboxypeptidase-like regulatory domain-containing protein [Sphingomonadales bacterium]